MVRLKLSQSPKLSWWKDVKIESIDDIRLSWYLSNNEKNTPNQADLKQKGGNKWKEEGGLIYPFTFFFFGMGRKNDLMRTIQSLRPPIVYIKKAARKNRYNWKNWSKEVKKRQMMISFFTHIFVSSFFFFDAPMSWKEVTFFFVASLFQSSCAYVYLKLMNHCPKSTYERSKRIIICWSCLWYLLILS